MELGVSLGEMLEARDRRVSRQNELICGYNRPLICFTMNIAGEIKHNGTIDAAFFVGCREIEKRVDVLYTECSIEKTGCTAYFVCEGEAAEIKKSMVTLEDAQSVGRLYDIDVLDRSEGKLSRSIPRRCLICGNEAGICARSRAHTVAELFERANALCRENICGVLSGMAEEALLREVKATPKPGLVDRRNNGSHDDMDIGMFEKSAETLRPYFHDIVKTTFENAELVPKALMELLQEVGKRAEQAMLDITGGVNTHKGAIYTIGLLLAGCALAIDRSEESEKILQYAGQLASTVSVQGLKADGAQRSNGQIIYDQMGIRGVRGEAESGFPHVAMTAKWLYEYKSQGMSENDSRVISLVRIMSSLDDTNLIKRGGKEGLDFAKREAERILSYSPEKAVRELYVLDDSFISMNLSPGGCADILAAGMLYNDVQCLFAE